MITLYKFLSFCIGVAIYLIFLCGCGFVLCWLWGLDFSEAVNTQTGEPISPYIMAVMFGGIHIGVIYALYAAFDFGALIARATGKALNNS